MIQTGLNLKLPTVRLTLPEAGSISTSKNNDDLFGYEVIGLRFNSIKNCPDKGVKTDNQEYPESIIRIESSPSLDDPSLQPKISAVDSEASFVPTHDQTQKWLNQPIIRHREREVNDGDFYAGALNHEYKPADAFDFHLERPLTARVRSLNESITCEKMFYQCVCPYDNH